MLVRRLESVAHLDGDVDGLLDRQRPRRHHFPERRAGNVRHGDERDAVRLSGVVDRADVRVAERRGGAGFVEQALPIGVGEVSVGWQYLDGGVPAEARVLGPVNNPVSSAPQLLDDVVLCQSPPDHFLLPPEAPVPYYLYV